MNFLSSRAITLILGIFFLISSLAVQSQNNFLRPADSLSVGRVWTAFGSTAVLYSATVIGLNEIWYKDYERSSFHSFNDWNEWENMDKFGHAFSAYFMSSYIYDMARWTGLKKNPSLLIGGSLATLFQGTIEILDGHSEKWGFSIYDIAFNTGGVMIFVGQELLWNDQRMVLKVSNRFPSYSKELLDSETGITQSSVETRAKDLFGSAPTTKFIKDYNGQTIWLSMNPSAFVPESKFPKWLNFAVGYGAENLLGGFSNSWIEGDETYTLDPNVYPRQNQLFFSFDIDLKRIGVKKPFWRAILKGLNVFKIPSPTLSFTRNQGVKFHPLYW